MLRKLLFAALLPVAMLLSLSGCGSDSIVPVPPTHTPEQVFALTKVTYAGALNTASALYEKGVITPEDLLTINDYQDKIQIAIEEIDGFILAHASEDLLKPKIDTLVDLVARLSEAVAKYDPAWGA